METNNQLCGTDPKINVSGKWLRFALWYTKTPILKHINPFFFLVFLLATTLVLIIPRGNCTCEEQLPDQALQSRELQNNKEVQAHLKARDNVIICAARQQELLEKLEKGKRLRIKKN
ncbi:hypothetical protein [Pedobacter sp. NJ-S-72]